MIVDTLDQSDLYAGAHARLPIAFRYLRALAPNLPDGRHEIDGQNVFGLVQSYTTTPASERKFEHHRRYVDVQYVISGEEVIEHSPLAGLAVETPYNPEKDFGLVIDPLTRSTIVLRSGQFGIFFPDDAHKPGCSLGSPTAVRKVVVKVLL